MNYHKDQFAWVSADEDSSLLAFGAEFDLFFALRVKKSAVVFASPM
jgi:hypothetical protein